MRNELPKIDLDKEMQGKTLEELFTPLNSGKIRPLVKAKRISVAEMRTITDQWQREEISYSRMVELINEHFSIFNNGVTMISKLPET